MEAPVIAIGDVPVQPLILEPAVAVGLRFHVMVRLDVAVCPLHEPPVTATVRVAVKLPLVVVGVK
jgi:hypothetical protein